MPDDFRDAIRDLDRGHMGGAREHILNEIRYHPNVDPQRIVRDINRTECEPGHAHQTVELVNRNGYLDVVPANYGPPPGYEGRYYPPGRRPDVVAPVVTGIAAGVVLDELLHRHRH